MSNNDFLVRAEDIPIIREHQRWKLREGGWNVHYEAGNTGFSFDSADESDAEYALKGALAYIAWYRFLTDGES